MGANDQALQEALSWETDSAIPEDKSVWVWLWESIQGDFNQERSGGQIAFDMAVSMVPLVDQVCDVRDIIANCKAIYQADEQETAGEPADTTWLWISLGLTLIGLFPTLGSLVKGVLKLFFVFIRRYGLEHLIRAVEEGMTWVIAYLRKREVQKYISNKHIDEIFKWLAERIRELKGKLSVSALLANFDRGIKIMKGLLAKVDWMPGKVGERARAAIEMVENVRSRARDHLPDLITPLNRILDTIIRRLEFENLVIRRGIVDVSNIHFRGGLPESRAVALIRETEPPPKWLSKGRELEFPGLDPDSPKVVQQKQRAEAHGWPELNEDNISSFHRMEAAEIVGPAKLYRVVSPSNGAMGDCWVSQEVWDMIQKTPDPKAAWRKHLGVWPDWNPNGQFVVMDIPPGETVKVWRGPAAGQVKDEKVGLDAHLEGGWEQIVVKGPEEPADTFKFYRRDSDGRLDAPIDYPAFKALSAEEKAAYIGIREKINHPRIRGPLDTTWGYTDFDSQLQDVKIGLPNLPGQTLN